MLTFVSFVLPPANVLICMIDSSVPCSDFRLHHTGTSAAPAQPGQSDRHPPLRPLPQGGQPHARQRHPNRSPMDEPPAYHYLSSVRVCTGLATSLFSTFLAMPAKQWLDQYDAANVRGSIVDRSRNRRRKLNGVVALCFDRMMELPLVLQATLSPPPPTRKWIGVPPNVPTLRHRGLVRLPVTCLSDFTARQQLRPERDAIRLGKR